MCKRFGGASHVHGGLCLWLSFATLEENSDPSFSPFDQVYRAAL